MTSLPQSLRSALAAEVTLDPLKRVTELITDNGDTLKSLYRTRDGLLVETVLMFYRDRTTVCVSCQVGCAVGCAFCATGIGGLQRNLTAGEMVSQVIRAARLAATKERTLTNIVMMGMGEPFQNYAESLRFCRIINDPQGSTSGRAESRSQLLESYRESTNWPPILSRSTSPFHFMHPMTRCEVNSCRSTAAIRWPSFFGPVTAIRRSRSDGSRSNMRS